MSSRDPQYITPDIKCKLRRKNRLMRAGRQEEANAIASQISKKISRRDAVYLKKCDHATRSKDLWKAVQHYGKGVSARNAPIEIPPDELNKHYAHISTDRNYKSPELKQSADPINLEVFTEEDIFKILDHLKFTATGLDGIPAWLLRLGAPVFSAPIARLFNLSLSMSTVPHQWKQALICPIPKVKQAKVPSEFRPISITSVLSRTMEKLFVREFIYPSMNDPTLATMFADQFAFRPTGSTTAALIALLDKITELLTMNEYVSVFVLDFSKAFDSVHHSKLLNKAAILPIPDQAFNWLVQYFKDHSHCTRTGNGVSQFEAINSSVIQGSGIGPGAYDINASDLQTVVETNCLFKFADDTTLVIPAKK